MGISSSESRKLDLNRRISRLKESLIRGGFRGLAPWQGIPFFFLKFQLLFQRFEKRKEFILLLHVFYHFCIALWSYFIQFSRCLTLDLAALILITQSNREMNRRKKLFRSVERKISKDFVRLLYAHCKVGELEKISYAHSCSLVFLNDLPYASDQKQEWKKKSWVQILGVSICVNT